VCVVILDLIMPRMNGFGGLHAIANDPKLSALRVHLDVRAGSRTTRAAMSAETH
jgi:CheY-like chemotaxis protein